MHAHVHHPRATANAPNAAAMLLLLLLLRVLPLRHAR